MYVFRTRQIADNEDSWRVQQKTFQAEVSLLKIVFFMNLWKPIILFNTNVYQALAFNLDQTSLRSTSSGGLLSTLPILLIPMSNTNKVIPGKNTKKGTIEGTKGSSNNKVANN